MDEIYAIEKMTAKPDRVEDLKHLIQTAATRTRQEPGCRQIEAFQSRENPAQFVVFVIWRDQEAVKAHRSAAWHQEIVSRLAEVLTEPQEGIRGRRIV